MFNSRVDEKTNPRHTTFLLSTTQKRMRSLIPSMGLEPAWGWSQVDCIPEALEEISRTDSPLIGSVLMKPKAADRGQRHDGRLD